MELLRSKTILFFFVFIYQLLFSQENDIELKISDKKEVSLAFASQINLSKRGIVLLSHIHKDKWRIVGHRKGFVVLSYWNQEENQEKQIFITVSSKKDSLLEGLKMSSFCSVEGVRCSSEPYQIKGKTASWKSFYFLKKWCQEEKECLFDLSLNQKGQKELKESLKRNPLLDRCSVDSDGVDLCLFSCSASKSLSPQRKKRSRDSLESEGVLTYVPFSCSSSVEPRKFLVQAKVISSSQGLASELGFSKFLAREIMKENFSWSSSFFKLVKLDQSNSSLEIVGSPSMKVLEGSRSLSKTGGELSVVRESSSSKTYQKTLDWKSYGLELDVLVMSLRKNQVKLAYELKMSNPSEGNGRISLQGVSMKGEVFLILEESELVGSTDYMREKKSKEENFFLSKIPLIGPFFRLHKKEKVMSKMLLYLMVKEVT